MTFDNYGWEKLHLAVNSLAGSGSQSERLVSAITFNLIHIEPNTNLPESIHSEFNSFMERMSPDNGATVQATVDQLNEIELKQAIEEIISMYDSVCRHMEPD